MFPMATSAMGYSSDLPAGTWGGGFDAAYDEFLELEYAARPAPAAPSLWEYVGTGAYDPFQTGHTQMTDRMMQYLRNCEYLHL